MTLVDHRRPYPKLELLEDGAPTDPTALLQRWLDDAIARGLQEPNAMTLATVDATGQPRARVVLLRGLEQRGLQFFTNYESAKARELDHQAKASVCFLWAELARQARVEGSVSKISERDSDEYFASRPRGHQIGAWASAQSSVIASREVLEARVIELEQRFANVPVPRPPFWGGYRLEPQLYEFWQGRADRLHDRLRYLRDGGSWRIERLSP